MQIIVNNEIKVLTQGVDDYIAVRTFCDKELTFANPEYTKKVKLGKYIGNTPEYLTLYRFVDPYWYLPYGCLKRFLNYAYKSNNNLKVNIDSSSLKRDREFIDYGQIPLRDYQSRAVKIMVDAKGGILQSRAGSGKTQIGLGIIAKLGKKALWLTHTKDLLNQSRDRALEYIDESLIGTITDGKVNIGKGITFATVQTMVNLDLNLLNNTFDVIIVDECHRVSGSTTKVKQFQKVLENLSAPFKYGLSATVHRADGLIETMYNLIGDLTYTIPDDEVKNYVMPVSIKPIYTNIPMSYEILDTSGMLDFQKTISYLCEEKGRNNLIISYLEENRFNSNLILSDRTEHLKKLMDLLPHSLKDKAVYIDGTSTKKQRETALEQMKSKEKNFLFATYKLAKEGLDIPCLDRLYLATPQKDYAIVVQSIGRIARRQKGKLDPVVYDFVDSNIVYLNNFFNQRLKHYKREGCTIL